MTQNEGRKMKQYLLFGLAALFLVTLGQAAFAQCPAAPAIPITINELQYAITSGNPTLTNYIEIKAPAGQSLDCFYLVSFDTNCSVSNAQDLTGFTIVNAETGGSDAGYFVITQDATRYSTLYGKNAELETFFPDLNDGPASLQIRYNPTQLSKGTSCAAVGGTIYDSLGYANSSGTTPSVFGGETQAVSPGLSTDAGGSMYRVSDQDTQNNHSDFVLGNESVATPGSKNQSAVSLAPGKLGFSDTVVGVTSASSAVTLTNNGAIPLLITSSNGIVATGDFLVNDNCPRSPSSIAVGGSCTINVSFQPTQTGARTGNVNITDSAAGSPQSITLSGNGINSSFFFSDDFEDGNLTTPLWSTKGTWSVVSGFATGTTAKKADLISPDFGKCSLCTFETNMKINANGRISLFAWFKDSKNNVEIRLYQDKQKLMVKQKGAGLTAGKSVSTTVAANTVYNVKAVYDGSTIQVLIDDVLKVTLTPIAVPSGNLYFRVKSTTGAPLQGAVADIKVY